MNAHASELKDRIERKKERQDKLAKLGKTASGFMAAALLLGGLASLKNRDIDDDTKDIITNNPNPAPTASTISGAEHVHNYEQKVGTLIVRNKSDDICMQLIKRKYEYCEGCGDIRDEEVLETTNIAHAGLDGEGYGKCINDGCNYSKERETACVHRHLDNNRWQPVIDDGEVDSIVCGDLADYAQTCPDCFETITIKKPFYHDNFWNLDYAQYSDEKHHWLESVCATCGKENLVVGSLKEHVIHKKAGTCSANGKETCSDCGYTKELEKDPNNHNYKEHRENLKILGSNEKVCSIESVDSWEECEDCGKTKGGYDKNGVWQDKLVRTILSYTSHSPLNEVQYEDGTLEGRCVGCGHEIRKIDGDWICDACK